MIRRVSLAILFCVLVPVGPATGHGLGTEEERREGRLLYEKYCAQCHGDEGDGRGVAAAYQKPRPRDFTRGLFKVRSTPTGQLPTDEDLKRVIRQGMPYTAMPGFPELRERQLTVLVDYLKTFYPGFAGERAEVEAIPVPRPPRVTEDSIRRGKEVYDYLGCAQCHGNTGRGDGPSAPSLADDWDYHLRSANLTKPWTFRGGADRRDIYRTMMTGFNGTPMPSFEDEGALPSEDRWPLVDYIYSLSEAPEPNYSSLLRAIPLAGIVDLERGVDLFEGAPMARFPVVGQIMEPGRNFYPSVTAIEARAVYDFESIALLLQWDDMRADVSASNSPTMPVPLFDPVEEEEAERVPRAAQADPDDFWGMGGDDSTDIFEVESPAPAVREPAFSDAVAIQFPQRFPRGFERPYFVFGDTRNGVELWFVDLADPRPQLLVARGSDSIESGDGERFEVRTEFREGRWSAVFKRRRSSVRSISFAEAEFVPIAFSVWDGSNRERGNRRGLTSWFHLYLEPMEKPSPYAPMATNFLVVLASLVLVVFVVRRRYSPGNQYPPPNEQEKT
jgi:mono/diheme cytochrome c family protein